MATILAYTTPALGHLYPICALLLELRDRGHNIALRTLEAGVRTGRELGFAAQALDPRIEGITRDDEQAPNHRAALRRAFETFAQRAELEVGDLRSAIAHVRPDVLIIDSNCGGAATVADASGLPWVSFWPHTPYLRSRGMPPFGPGLRPWPGMMGRVRDGALRPLIHGIIERSMLPRLNKLRAEVGVMPVHSADEYLRRAHLLLVAGGEPFEYPHPDWGESVQMIGPCSFDPAGEADVDWLDDIDRRIILVSTSSERVKNTDLAQRTMLALADEPVHVVATFPAGVPDNITVPSNATVREFVPHSAVLDRAVCAVTHGGMGATQKALERGVPVCVVPHGRDQFEVARRVEVAQCGTRLPYRKLTTARLRAEVLRAMTMSEGARRVAKGYAATGGVAHGADLIEQRLIGHLNNRPSERPAPGGRLVNRQGSR
jgi:MGT family glycosyltransferase